MHENDMSRESSEKLGEVSVLYSENVPNFTMCNMSGRLFL